MIQKTPDVSVEREEQTELDEPFKIAWSGKLRATVQQRQSDQVVAVNDKGENVVSERCYGEDADDLIQCSALTYRALDRYKTIIVLETVDEARAVYRILDYYKDGAGTNGITWVNGAQQSSVRRVRREIREALKERGYAFTDGN